MSPPTYSRRPYRSHTASALVISALSRDAVLLPDSVCPNYEFFDPSDCKEVAVSLDFANFDGSADHVSRDRQTEFLRAGPKHSQFSDKLLWRDHR